MRKGPAWRRSLRLLKYIIIWGWAWVSAAPIVVSFLSSLKSSYQITSSPPIYFFWPSLQNYSVFFLTWFGTAIIGGIHYFPEMIANSAIVSLGGSVLALAVGIVASFSLSTFSLPGKRAIMALVLMVSMIPESVLAVALLFYTRSIGLYDTFLGVILVDFLLALPFIIWLARAFFDSLQRESYEASLLDGCSPLQALRRIVLPQSREGLTVAFLFAFITAWNEFVISETITASHVVLAMTYVDDFDTLVSIGLSWGWFAVLLTLYSAIPIAIAYLMRDHLVKGLTVGTVRKEVKAEAQRVS